MVSIDNGNTSATGNGYAASKAVLDVSTSAPLASESNGAQPEIDASRRRKSTILPLEAGTRVNCHWRDGKYHPVKVIERRKLPPGGAKDYEYYVHYTELNRRLDEWANLEHLDLSSVETDVDEKVEDKRLLPQEDADM